MWYQCGINATEIRELRDALVLETNLKQEKYQHQCSKEKALERSANSGQSDSQAIKVKIINLKNHHLNNSEILGSSSPLGSEDAAASKVKDVDLSDIILAEEDVTEVLLGFIEIDSNIPKTEFLGSTINAGN